MVVFIRINGTPEERGVQQGEQLREKIHTGIATVFRSKMMTEVVPKIVPAAVVKAGLGFLGKKNIKKAIQQHLPGQYEKILGVAKGARISTNLTFGLHFIEVMAGNPKAMYQNPPVQACSMVFALPEATSDGSMLYARNYDFPTVLQPFQMVREDLPDEGYKNLTMSQYPWVSSHMGLNEKGLAMGFNFGRSWKQEPLDYRMKGVPSTLLLQEAIETCATTGEVIHFVTKFPARTNGGFYGVLDRSGDACVIETTSTRFALRRPEHGLMVHTNTYRTQELADANLPDEVLFKMDGIEVSPVRSPKLRYRRLEELTNKYRGTITTEMIKAILSDHAGGEPSLDTICTHAEDAGTLASIIVNPQTLQFWVTDRRPCESEFEEFKL